MSQESEQAQEACKAWEEHQGWFHTKVGTYYQGIPFGRNVLDDYKAALKAEIEKEFPVNSGTLMDQAYKKWFLSLLDTVTPIKN